MKDFMDEMVKRAIQETKKESIKTKEERTKEALRNVVSRAIDTEGFNEYDIEKYARMYTNLAPHDLTEKISIKMMYNFLEKARGEKRISDEEYNKLMRAYDYRNPLPEKKMKKLMVSIDNIWSRLQTIENAIEYSFAFSNFSKEISPKLDTPNDMSLLERVKWLRLWCLIIQDQGLYWADINKNKKIDIEKVKIFDREVYLTPDIMLEFREAFAQMPDSSILLEMLKELIGLYPKTVQQEIYQFGEFDKNEPDCLRAGWVRENIKKKLFPVMWISGMGYFCSIHGIKTSRAELLSMAVEAKKNGGIKELPWFYQEGTDPYDNFVRKKTKTYEISHIKENGEQYEKVFAVTCENELDMYVKVYEWLIKHPDVKFGREGEEKNIQEYYEMGIFRKSEDALITEWCLDMGLATSEDDVNLELIKEIFADDTENCFKEYSLGKISCEEVLAIGGFSTEGQARICCSKTAKILPSEEIKMSGALKRYKMFGAQILKSDKIYYLLFENLIKNKNIKLPKSLLKTYGKMIK